MNEWSPGGNFSRPGTPSQPAGRSFRSQWEDPEKCSRPLVVNIRAVSESKSKSFQQHSLEDMSKSSISISSKTKKIGNNGVSDPRFKRVISNCLQNDSLGSETKLGKPTNNQSEDDNLKCKHSDCNTAEYKSNQPWGNMAEIKEAAKPPSALLGDEPLDLDNMTQIEPANFGQAQDHLKAVEKLTFNYDIAMKSNSKESMSDCTINTRNTSLASEDLMDDTANNDLSEFPSATRVRNVQHWIQDQKPKLEKKQSVITVIGQMQGQDTLNSALREIDKRRKLVKELDKYAICSKITDTDKEKEISQLITKISYLTSCKKHSPDNMSLAEALPTEKFMCDGSGDKIDNHFATNDAILNSFNIKQMDSTQSIWNNKKRSVARKNIKKNHRNNEYLEKGKIQEVLNFSHYHWIFYTVILISGIVCWTMFTVLHSSYESFDFFAKKPKTMSWYEKICMWLWELFRPSGNYKRNTPWNGY